MKNGNLEFCRVKMTRYGAPGQATTIIGKRVNPGQTKNPAQIFEIKVTRANGVFPAMAKCTENYEELFSFEAHMSHGVVERAAIAALKAILAERERHHRMRKNKRTTE